MFSTYKETGQVYTIDRQGGVKRAPTGPIERCSFEKLVGGVKGPFYLLRQYALTARGKRPE